ncbi:MAG TPA: DUF1501 domain-containing protein [Opitutaceae bacterium]|nr:DUF1501 domain-containing protein [Opitutaceae bacterium]
MPDPSRPDHGPCCGVSTDPADYFLSRRQFLQRMGMGIGALSLATLLDGSDLAGPAHPAALAGPLAPKPPMFPARAKAVIHIFAQGAPSHIDTWDPKPELSRMDGRALPDGGIAMGSPFRFSPMGQSGIEVSELFPNVGRQVDQLAVIRSMYTDIPAHDVATVFMNTGSLRIVKPSMGSWVVYGLGTVNQNLPGFIALRNGGLPPGGSTNYGAAFLPGIYQGTSINMQAASVQQMIQNIRNPYVYRPEQRRQMNLVDQLDEIQARAMQRDAALESRLQSYEIAFKMQAEATDAFDLAKESPEMRAAYGNTPQGRQLLVARRLVERGVRFVQVWHDGWDHHQDLQERITKKAREIDQPLSALLVDLRQRGLLDSTLVVWGGEFGRKPTKDRNGYDTPGRDHNGRGFTTWLAGGGVKGGQVYGATDPLGAEAVKDKVHVHDLHATILAALGLDHTKLTYRFNGRDFRLTDVAGNVVKPILA